MTLRVWRKILPPRIRARVVQAGRCWEWTGGVNGGDRRGWWIGGYGYVSFQGRVFRVHRWIYSFLVGDPGPLLHHTCRNRRCVRPNHLEPATSQENNQARYDDQ